MDNSGRIDWRCVSFHTGDSPQTRTCAAGEVETIQRAGIPVRMVSVWERGRAALRIVVPAPLRWDAFDALNPRAVVGAVPSLGRFPSAVEMGGEA